MLQYLIYFAIAQLINSNFLVIFVYYRNRTLLPSQVIPIEDFEIDDRVTWDLDESLEMEMELVERKMAFDLAKSTRALEKAREFFIDPIRNLQIELRAIK